MKKKNKSFNYVFFLMLAIVFLLSMSTSIWTSDEAYTKGVLMQDLEAGKVTGASVQPNEETPTGSVSVYFANGERKLLYVTDVNEIQEILETYEIDPIVKDVPQESWFSAYIMPILMVILVPCPL